MRPALRIAITLLTPLLFAQDAVYEQGLKAYNSKDYAGAAKAWESGAQQGSAASQNALGLSYQQGLGVPKNLQRAIELFRESARKPYGPAEYNLGLAYHQGTGVPRNDAEAEKWFQLAATHGVPQAELSLGNLAYRSGAGDISGALKWWRQAAEHGEGAAAANVGFHYAEGRGVPKDLREAARWFQLGADAGNPQAQYSLGLLYRDGKGVRADPVTAMKWLALAAPNSAEASAAAQELRKSLSADQSGRAQRLASEWKPTAKPSESAGPRPVFASKAETPVFRRVGDPGPDMPWGGQTASGFVVGQQGYIVTPLAARGCSNLSMRTENGSTKLDFAASDETRHLTVLKPAQTGLPGLPLNVNATPSETEHVVNVGFQVNGLQAVRNAVPGVMRVQGSSDVDLRFTQNPPNQGGPVLDAHGSVIGMALPGSTRENTTVIDIQSIAGFLSSNRIAFIQGEGQGVEAARRSVVLVECKAP